MRTLGGWLGMGMIAALTLCAHGAESQPSSASADYALGPVSPSCDLRNMVREHIVRRACKQLEAARTRRQKAFASAPEDQSAWKPWKESLRAAVLKALGPMPYGPSGGALNVRQVSRHERPGYVLQNVLFESLPGWDVNASVYLPLAEDFPPPWRAIVVPVGHSGKQMENYQIPAQVFARCGYVALTFDPPGMSGEKQGGNDHFNDGVRCYLTGHSSNRYFVIDALRCIDYLETREDVDLSNGVGMTGVSGGGTTTMFAAVLDERITASGPACCAVPNAQHPVLDGYAPCAETLAPGRFADGYDDTDLLAAALPTPVLLMAGAEDEVFNGDWSDQIAEEVKGLVSRGGMGDRFAYFSDPGGHAYTVAMALAFAKWMDRWVAETPERPLPEIQRDTLEMADHDLLKCHPRLDKNIFSVNAEWAQTLATSRSGLPVSEAARRLANVTVPVEVPGARLGPKSLVWFHHLQEIMLQPEPGIELPATFLCPARDGWRGSALLYFDDRGRWADLRKQGMLARISGFLNKATDGPAILTVDVRGWGDSEPADIPYEIAGWGARSRWIAFVSAALGDPVLAMRIRDGLAALAWLRAHGAIDEDRIVVGGRGMGGIVALHVAAIDGRVAGCFAAESLASFETLAVSRDYAWSHEAFLTGVLEHYDVPLLAASLTAPTLLAAPLDAMKHGLDQAGAEALYGAHEGLSVLPAANGRADEGEIQKFVTQALAR